MAVIRRTPTLGSTFWRVWISTGVTTLGDAVLFAAAPLLAASITRDPALVAGLTSVSMLPMLLFNLHAGAIIDRSDRKQVMLLSNIARAALLTVLTMAIVGNWANLWFLYAIVFLVGIAEVFFSNASQTILPNIVPKEHLEAANSRLYGADIVARRLLGYPLASLLFTVLHFVPFAISTLGFLVSSFLISPIAGSFRAERKDAAKRSLNQEIKEGLTWLWRHAFLRNLALCAGIINLVESATFAVFVLYVLEFMGLKEFHYGLLLSVGAIGGLLGSVVAEKTTARLGRGNTLVLMIVLNVFSKLLMVFFPNFYAVALLSILSNFGGFIANVLIVSTRQSLIPDQLRGRVNSAYRLFVIGLTPIGALLGGWVAKTTSLPMVYLLSAVLLVGTAIFARFVVSGLFEDSLREKEEDFVFEY